MLPKDKTFTVADVLPVCTTPRDVQIQSYVDPLSSFGCWQPGGLFARWAGANGQILWVLADAKVEGVALWIANAVAKLPSS